MIVDTYHFPIMIVAMVSFVEPLGFNAVGKGKKGSTIGVEAQIQVSRTQLGYQVD